MKFAVIGTGKTGGKVVSVLDDEQVVGPFDSSHKPTANALKKADAAILFVPGSAAEELIEPLLESRIPAAWGTTGYEWPDKVNGRLKQQDVRWLKASNFSLGMNIVRRCLNIIGKSAPVLTEPEFQIHEIHHVHKQDAPSGTALSWEQWLGQEAQITSERKGDIKGIHRLEVNTDTESIKLEHQAHKREIFAEGAVWAATQLVKMDIAPGLHDFSTIFDKVMQQQWK
ncbi:MAG TPA: dihydrodipicolinate reductase C-terminal domain-containing protein [Fodinibius sp.]|nr:dihydrodipicolinate reductase C-terminal domain-containing protein [Fodinibius sp.]